MEVHFPNLRQELLSAAIESFSAGNCTEMAPTAAAVMLPEPMPAAMPSAVGVK